MRKLGHVCVVLYLFCAVNVVSTFVPGGPQLGIAPAYLVVAVIACVSGASWVLREAAPIELPRRPWVVYRMLSRPTLVVGLSAAAAAILVFLYDGMATNWSGIWPRGAFATAGVLAALLALTLYGGQAFIHGSRAPASDQTWLARRQAQ
jgi:hypothetical protein